MSKTTFTVEECISKLSRVVPQWPYVKTILTFGKVFELPEAEQINYHKQPRTVETVLTGDELKSQYDVCVSANVLNSAKSVDEAIAELAQVNFDFAIVQIDEGSKSGKRTGTKAKGYNQNLAVEKYVRPLQQNFHKYDITLHRADNLIVIYKGRKYFELDK